MKKIFAFDMGKASIGYCVREENDIKEIGSLIIDINHSSVKENRDRRRTNKTLEAHRARECWFEDLWKSAGLHILEKNDKRFQKEFATKNDSKLYNSTILRCALIMGIQLEEWQIYKAIHSAMQRRGYDENIAWSKTSEDKENEEAVKKYTCEDDIELIINEEYKYPCFYDALLQGLWKEDTPNIFERTIGLTPQKIRTSGRVAPRCLVEKELRKLWEEAKKQLTALQHISTGEFLYGEYREAYGSYSNPEWIQYRGTKKDWQGVLGQKIPRFDNRIISKCKLLPKRNVCSADTIENISFTLLMKLKNFRYTNAFTFDSGNMLSPDEIKSIYENKLPDWIEKLNIKRKDKKKNPTFTLTQTDIESVIGKKTIKDKIEPFKANISGRSSFCRRACKIMIDIIISGKNPNEINVEQYIDKEGTKNGITKEEVQTMLSKIGTWNNLFIPDNRDEMAQISQDANEKSDILIGNITNPVVRNRLQIFKNKLNELILEYGKPDEVIFEFVRDGADNSLFGSIKAKANENYIKKQEKENEEIKKKLDEVNANCDDNFLKYKLALMQDFKCIYSGKKIGINDFNLCQIDHIYPKTLGGNDALYNKVICFNKENQDKKGRTPYQWLYSDKERWAEYSNRVLNLKDKLGKKKSDLLLLPPDKCEKLIESYNALAETAQVAKVASSITHFICGWGMQTKNEQRHVFVENGSITAKIRSIYKLNSILGDDKKKNRNNPKHHALDAICISYSRHLKLNNQNKYFVEGFSRQYVEQKIAELMPFPYTHKKPLKANVRPKETIYGKRIIDGKAYITSRTSILEIKQDLKSIKNILDKVIKDDLTKKLEEQMSSTDWTNMLKNYIHPKKKTKVNKVLTIESEGVLEHDNNGRERIGEYVDFGTKGTKGQFKHSKGHKGQILYYDKKGNIKVMPIFANKSTKEVKEQLLEMGCKLYNRGEVFYSGCLINIPNEFPAGSIKHPQGVYKLRTIKAQGTINIENNVGIEIITSAKNLATVNFTKMKD